ncbi:MAG TPA: hypothetical protein DEP35_05470 [Deltaproteobacteria bacterium]|nr:hypothetical protein [Deltaproteobacteria bacterium]
MSSTDACRTARAALEEAFLERRTPGSEIRAHLDSCVACREVETELRAVAEALRALPAGAPPEPLIARTLLRGRAELSSQSPALARAGPLGPRLPRGFAGEFLRLFGVATAALPLVLVWNTLVLRLGGRLLAGFVPEPVLSVLAGAYLASVAGWMAFVYGSIPFVAHRRVQRATSEVTG